MRKNLSIILVNFRSVEYIAINIVNLIENNLDFCFQIIIVNNEFGANLSLLKQINEKYKEGHTFLFLEGLPQIVSTIDSGSYHHAGAVNYGLNFVENRYLLILDPDFFLLQEGSLKTILEEMRDEKYFLGSTWNAANFTKIRSFPSVHFFLIDTKKVPLCMLDFTPDLTSNRWRKKLGAKCYEFAQTLNNSKILRPLVIIVSRLGNFFRYRSSCDTGHRIYRYFGPTLKKSKEYQNFTFLYSKFWFIKRYNRGLKFFRGISFWVLVLKGHLNRIYQLPFLESFSKVYPQIEGWDQFTYKKVMAFHVKRTTERSIQSKDLIKDRKASRKSEEIVLEILNFFGSSRLKKTFDQLF